MSFFSKLSFIAGELDLQITFKKKGEKITVGVFPTSNNSEISERIKPIVMTGTDAELDEGFFLNLTPAVEKISGLITNIESVDAELKKLEEQKKGKVAGTKAKATESKKEEAAKKQQPKSNGEADEEQEEEQSPKEVQQSIFE